MLARTGLFSALLFAAGALAQQQQQKGTVFLCSVFSNTTTPKGAPGTHVDIAMRDVSSDIIESICDTLTTTWSAMNAEDPDDQLNCFNDLERNYTTIGAHVPLMMHGFPADPDRALSLFLDFVETGINGTLGFQNLTNATGCHFVDFDQAQFDANEDNDDTKSVYPQRQLQFNHYELVRLQTVSMTKGSPAVQAPDWNTVKNNLGWTLSQLADTGRTIGTSDAPITDGIWLKVMYDTLYKTQGTNNLDIDSDLWSDLIGQMVTTLATAKNGEDCIAVSGSNYGNEPVEADNRLSLMVQACFTN